jgi:hypothetical protein
MMIYRSCNNAFLAPSRHWVAKWTHLHSCSFVSPHIAKYLILFLFLGPLRSWYICSQDCRVHSLERKMALGFE